MLGAAKILERAAVTSSMLGVLAELRRALFKKTFRRVVTSHYCGRLVLVRVPPSRLELLLVDEEYAG